MPTFHPAVVFILAALLSVLFTGAALRLLERRRILDHPNARSSHARPVPRGGGIGVMAAVLGLWTAAALAGGPAPEWPLLLGTAAVMAISWIDDLRSLPQLPRVAVQAVAVALGLWALPVDALVLQGLLPLWADRAVAGLGWIWFLNLYNFMDGIDGITGVETIVIGGASALIFTLGGMAADAPLAAALAGAGLGFLVWNWQPARIFLGDVGSIPLGYLCGALLIQLCANGAWAAALVIPAVYWIDATATLLGRALRRQAFWNAHREHAYQKAVDRGLSHRTVCGAILALGVVLGGLALAASVGKAPISPWIALAVSAMLTIAFLRLIAGRPDP